MHGTIKTAYSGLVHRHPLVRQTPPHCKHVDVPLLVTLTLDKNSRSSSRCPHLSGHTHATGHSHQTAVLYRLPRMMPQKIKKLYSCRIEKTLHQS